MVLVAGARGTTARWYIAIVAVCQLAKLHAIQRPLSELNLAALASGEERCAHAPSKSVIFGHTRARLSIRPLSNFYFLALIWPLRDFFIEMVYEHLQ